MTLTLITPPATPVVSLAELKLHLRVDFSDDDALIAALEATAVGYLDGWRGVLGRAILSQVWRQEFTGWGALDLALPDVSAVTVTYLDANGAEQAATTAVLRQGSAGQFVEADGPSADRIFVNMTSAMGTAHLEVAKTIIKMLVAHWYTNREAVGPSAMADAPMSANALIGAMRWNRL